LQHTAEEVWALIHPAENGPVLFPRQIAQGFKVPGTPDGVGEQQCFIDVAGNKSILEVIEYDEGRRAVTRTLSPPDPDRTRMVYSLEPLGSGCILSLSLEMDASAEHCLNSTGRDQRRRRAQAQIYLLRVRQALDRGEVRR
jgi:hypothetical protein